jgi:phospholipid/cholesterol/gamma-HCH transport system substrate-binding protein
MEKKEVKQRVKLGAFVITGALLLVVSLLFIGTASNLFSKTFTIAAIFKNVEGLKEGDKVWLSGVQIGTVKSVRIVKVGEVIVSLSLKEKQNDFIRKNASASIGSDGLIGNRIVVIQPGNSKEVIKDADTIKAISPADTQEIINIAKEVGENTRSITLDLKAISDKVNNGQGIIGELLNEGTFAKDIRKVVSSFKATGDQTNKAAQSLTNLIDEAQHGKGILPTLINDTSFVSVSKQTLIHVKKVSANAASMSTSIEAVTAKINTKNNAVGVLLSDTVAAAELKAIIKNTESASVKLDENLEAFKHNFLTRGYFRRKARADKKALQKLSESK